MIYGTIVEIDGDKIQIVMKNFLPLIYLSLSICMLNVGCKSTKQQTEKVPNLPAGRQGSEPEYSVRTLNPAQPIKISIPKLRFPEIPDRGDSLFASIERTPCYGRCPTYSISIYKSGYVIYEGIRFVDRLGTYSTRISEKKIQNIINKANEIGYFELEEIYDSPVTDLPSTITYLSVNGQIKRIKDRVRGPEVLKEYEKYFDNVFEDMEWKKIEDNRQ